MANIASTDVTYAYNTVNNIGRSKMIELTISFGDGALWYPSGGIPLTISKLGFKRNVESLTILESNGQALLFEWDRSANTIRIFYPTQETGSAGYRAGVEFTAGVTAPAATVLECLAIGW